MTDVDPVGRDRTLPTPNRPASGKHVPELDGVRGIAIGGVMALHFVCNMVVTPHSLIERAASKATSYGVWGVDLFFVLSGFLITGILYDAKGGAHYFRSFYVRRTLRIFPLYYGVLLVLMVLIPASVLSAHAPALLEARDAQLWLWSYLSNVYLAIKGDFSLPYLSHFWTLAIEEHFYLVWPLMIAVLSRQAAMRACIALSICSLALRIAILYIGPNEISAQVLTPCRLDTLCVGAWFALAARGPDGIDPLGARVRRFMPVAAGGVLLLSLWHVATTVGDRIVVSARGTVLAIFFGAFITLVAWQGGPPALRRGLRARWIVTLGKYSYGLYVFHAIVAYVMHERKTLASDESVIGSPALALFVHALGAVLLSLLISFASYELYEVRFLRLKQRFEVGRAPGKSRKQLAPELADPGAS